MNDDDKLRLARNTHAIGILLVVLIVAVVLAGYTLISVERLSGRFSMFKPLTIEDIRNAVRTEVGAMLEAEWVDATGTTRTVKTVKNEPGHENETEAAFQARHDVRYKAQLALYPK